MVTCYDYPSALLLEEAGVDMLLVGDSVGDNVLGYQNTLPVTMEEMLHHTRAVCRGAHRAFTVADMPFMSYQASPEQALVNAARFMKEAGAQSVKLEGGASVAPLVERMTSVGIPVMGHIGLTPQSVHQVGGYRVQGREEQVADRLVRDARTLADAGAFSIVLELVSAEVAARVTAAVDIPTIGIGSGPGCDGQVLVFHDLLGLYPDRGYRHSRRYAEIGEAIKQAVGQYAEDVRTGTFPGPENSY